MSSSQRDCVIRPSGTANDFDPSTVPPGREFSASLPRHFEPGYYQPVPPGTKAIRQSKGQRPRIKFALRRVRSNRRLPISHSAATLPLKIVGPSGPIPKGHIISSKHRARRRLPPSFVASWPANEALRYTTRRVSRLNRKQRTTPSI